jgi:CDP-glucose 4,6-dehydratase
MNGELEDCEPQSWDKAIFLDHDRHSSLPVHGQVARSGTHDRGGTLGTLVMRTINRAFWRSRRVLVTGHTGFKGAWLALLLHQAGARVTGIALPPDQSANAFVALGIRERVDHYEIDTRNGAALTATVRAAEPEFVFHLAAQALVGKSYRDPVGTFEVNVNGTVNFVNALRELRVSAAVIVTSDKVYKNDGRGRPFIETDPLGGDDPYSASKAACEMAVASFVKSFREELPAVATARAGNVIGGGDFGQERLIPDLIRSEMAGSELVVRRPDATRPFQHLFDVLTGYVLLAETLAQDPDNVPPAVNIGPEQKETSVRALLDGYGAARDRPVRWRAASAPAFSEAERLMLDATLISDRLGWRPRYDIGAALKETALWYEAWLRGEDMSRHSVDAVERLLSQ